MASFFDFQDDLQSLKRGDKSAPAPDNAPSTPLPPAISVAQLTARIERILKAGLPDSLLVRGEVSNFKLHSASGHAYFTLKDSLACINCVMFRNDFSRVKFDVGDGMDLLATGRVGLYPQRGSYQFYITRLEPLGQGALELAFRQLCAKLQAEGLFAPERKKPLPRYPLRIALLTSAATAALQDLLKVFARFPFLKLFLFHVPVQGEAAAAKIAQAIRDLSSPHPQLNHLDVIVLARGGGSLEDLWPFNEEIVARAMAQSTLPIITGIGHETDVSVADLLADYHAHTPTEAAQVLVSAWRSATDDLQATTLRLRQTLRARLQDASFKLDQAQRHEFFRRPADIVQTRKQRLDDMESDFSVVAAQQIAHVKQHIAALSLRLEQSSPRRLIAARRERMARLELAFQQRHPSRIIDLRRHEISSLEHRLQSALQHGLRRHTAHIEQLARHLNAIGPEQVLARGYSITRLKKTGQILRSKSQIPSGSRLLTRLADGEIQSITEDPRQGNLFD